MRLDANKQMFNAGIDMYALIQAWGDLSLMGMQKFTELQFAVVSTQMENVYEQLKLLCNVKTFNHFLPAEYGFGGVGRIGAVDISRNARTIHTAPGNKLVAQVTKRLTTTPMPKIKSAKRVIRKKNS